MEILKRPKKFFYAAQPFILSHHPECDVYRDHYIQIRSIKLCIGCFFGFLPSVITILVIIHYNLWTILDVRNAMILTFILLSLGVLFSLIKGRHKAYRILSKVFLSHGLAAVLLDHYYYLFITSYSTIKLAATIILYSLLIQLYYVTRFISDYNTCKKCHQFDQYPFCDGFKEIIKKLKSEGFLKIIEHTHSDQGYK